MGRGRAKAKQTKVARQLKYQTLETDYEKLQRELAGGAPASVEPEVDDEFEDDPYARWVEPDDDYGDRQQSRGA